MQQLSNIYPNTIRFKGQENSVRKTVKQFCSESLEELRNKEKRTFIKYSLYGAAIGLLLRNLKKNPSSKTLLQGIAIISTIPFMDYSLRFALFRPKKYCTPLIHFFQDQFKNHGMKEITIQSENNIKLSAWYRPPKNGKPTILYCHGRKSNITNNQELLEKLLKPHPDHGFLAIDYRQFGKSNGFVSMPGVFKDLDKTVEYLNSQNIPNEDIIVIGRSLGSFMSSNMVARDDNYRCLILNGMCTKATDFLNYHIGSKLGFQIKNLFGYRELNVSENVKNINNTPTIIVNSKSDEFMPISYIEQLEKDINGNKKNITFDLQDFGDHCGMSDSAAASINHFIEQHS